MSVRWAGFLAVMTVAALFGVAAASAGAQANAPGNVQNGKRIFAGAGCVQCHGAEAQGAPQAQIPGPRIGPLWIQFQAFARYLRRPTGRMPAYSVQTVPDRDLTDIFAFLQSIAPPPGEALNPAGNAENGQQIFTRYGCYQCHGYQGQGSLQTGAPIVGPPAIPFPAFRAYIRQPTGSMPPYTSKAVSDSEVADIYTFLQARPIAPLPESIPLLNQ
jgi:mono/diheme cytochrome c family protein